MSKRQLTRITMFTACTVLPLFYLFYAVLQAGVTGTRPSPSIATVALAVSGINLLLLCAEAVWFVLHLGSPKGHRGGDLDSKELEQACRNIGYDLTCGRCAGLFYTGMNFPSEEHNQNCNTHVIRRW